MPDGMKCFWSSTWEPDDFALRGKTSDNTVDRVSYFCYILPTYPYCIGKCKKLHFHKYITTAYDPINDFREGCPYFDFKGQFSVLMSSKLIILTNLKRAYTLKVETLRQNKGCRKCCFWSWTSVLRGPVSHFLDVLVSHGRSTNRVKGSLFSPNSAKCNN